MVLWTVDFTWIDQSHHLFHYKWNRRLFSRQANLVIVLVVLFQSFVCFCCNLIVCHWTCAYAEWCFSLREIRVGHSVLCAGSPGICGLVSSRWGRLSGVSALCVCACELVVIVLWASGPCFRRRGYGESSWPYVSVLSEARFTLA